MYEYHGWITIRQPNDFKILGNFKDVTLVIRDFIFNLGPSSNFLDIRKVQNICYISISGYRNHKGTEHSYLLEIYNFVRKVAPGSYGLLYIRDDEDREGHDNEFQVYVFARGTLTKRKDPLLSPCIPVLEDEYKNEYE